ncbi:unnamed protein product [Schistosoma margrebowiei]|uniref:Uncharacterized protein n=1 Tax=Schistosoma margrebowiei TaxID=48269 RepID=A0A183MEV4_9TREM|nr:unnamed protein product [Schistosoma margrebowiei]
MEHLNNVGDWEDQSNSNGNEEIQLGSTGNQRNPLNSSWTTKAKYERDAAVLRSRRRIFSTNSGSCFNTVKRFQTLNTCIIFTVQSSTKCTCRIGISRIQNHQSLIQNKEGEDHSEYYSMLCTHQ